MEYTQLGNLKASRFILGSNPFSGFSHQGEERDKEMLQYYTTAKIKEVWRQAEELGVNTCIARTDHYILRILSEYWNEGGKIQWIAQVSKDINGSLLQGAQHAIKAGAKACFLHGGIMDFLLANGKLDETVPIIEKIKESGLPAGLAGHNPKVFEWAEENLDTDFYMCSYFNPLDRKNSPSYKAGVSEIYHDEDRNTMVKKIQNLKRPVIHYKLLAAGRKIPEEAFSFAAKHLRPDDAVCVGVFVKENLNMVEEDIRIFLKYLNN